jgi:hypothetical protein
VIRVVLFWSSLATLVYAYVGFPLLTALRGLARPRPIASRPGHRPRLSVIMAAHNEEDALAAKLESVLAQDYPAERLELIVASDGSEDRTEAIAAGYADRGVRLLALSRRGKNATLNAAVAAASGEVLVFSDADAVLEPGALGALAADFADPEVGVVSGAFAYAPGAEGGPSGQRAYWDAEARLKHLQSLAGSTTGVSGALLAIRADLFREIPDGVTDDFYVAALGLSHGRRVVFEPDARCHGAPSAGSRSEYRRKVRIMSDGLRGVISMRGLLDPRRHGFVSVQVASHKVLRRLSVIPLLVLAVTAATLWRRSPVYALVAGGLAAIGLLGTIGLAAGERAAGRAKPFALPGFFLLVNAAALHSVCSVVRGRGEAPGWGNERAPAATRNGDGAAPAAPDGRLNGAGERPGAAELR